MFTHTRGSTDVSYYMRIYILLRTRLSVLTLLYYYTSRVMYDGLVIWTFSAASPPSGRAR